MSKPAQKFENYAISKQNYTLELIIALKMAYSCCFALRGNLYFPDFLQKSFITSISSQRRKKTLSDGNVHLKNEPFPASFFFYFSSFQYTARVMYILPIYILRV